ncbi:MAG: tripartite tricarboxylate transporter TctB family protein [Halomonas sp.]|uniref:tripartite tricarboxylate transporter TctB family protein n=1 Tax=Halomonas sp. TaxID=1486246 RepID=UPI003F91FDFA
MERDIGKPLFNLFLMITSAIAFVVASGIPDFEIVGDLSPAFFPQLLSGLIFLLALPCLVKDVNEWRMAAGARSQSAGVSRKRSIAQWLFIILLLIGYIVSFEPLGYIASTAFFTFVCVVGLAFVSGVWASLSAIERGKSLIATLVFALLLTLGIFYVFTELFNIPLPT